MRGVDHHCRHCADGEAAGPHSGPYELAPVGSAVRTSEAAPGGVVGIMTTEHEQEKVVSSYRIPIAARRGPGILSAALVSLCLWGGLALAAPGERLEIADGAGSPVLVLALEADRVTVSDGVGAPLLVGARAAPGRTDYRRPDGTAFAAAKGDAEAFKLSAPDGRLLRKVKRDGDRIKIADNAENAGAAVLRRRGEDKWEVELEQASFGKVKDYPADGRSRLKVKDREGETRYTLAATPLTPVPLVLLIPDLPPGEAQAVMAEILLRGWR